MERAPIYPERERERALFLEEERKPASPDPFSNQERERLMLCIYTMQYVT